LIFYSNFNTNFKKKRPMDKLTKISKKNQLLPKAKSRVAPDETTH
jgi:hypothetical protein